MRCKLHDQPVFQVLLVPKMKPEGTYGDKVHYSRTEEVPYSLQEIAGKVRRHAGSVLISLHRLEERGKQKRCPMAGNGTSDSLISFRCC